MLFRSHDEHTLREKTANIPWIKHALLAVIARNTKRWNNVHNVLIACDSTLDTTQFLLMKIIMSIGIAICCGFISILVRIRSNYLDSISVSSLVVFVVMITIVAYYIPDIILKIRFACRVGSTEDEVMRMLVVLIMLFPIKRMTVECILEWLALTTTILQPAIMDCIDCYLQDNEGALEELYEAMGNEAFRHIVKNLEVSDRIGILHAFEEVPSEYIYYIDKRKQDNEIRTDNLSAIGKVVAFVPMVLLIGGDLIIPFVLESISQFMCYITQMQAL